MADPINEADRAAQSSNILSDATKNMSRDLVAMAQELMNADRSLKTFVSNLSPKQLEELGKNTKILSEALGTLSAIEQARLLETRISQETINNLRGKTLPETVAMVRAELALNDAKTKAKILTYGQTKDIDMQIAAYQKVIETGHEYEKVLSRRATIDLQNVKRESDINKGGGRGLISAFLTSSLKTQGDKIAAQASKIFGADSSISKFISSNAMKVGAFGILAILAEKVLEGFAKIAKGEAMLFRIGGGLGANTWELAKSMGAAEIESLALGMRTEDLYKRIDTATSLYMGSLSGASQIQTERFSQMTRQVIDLSKASAFFGIDGEKATTTATNIARAFGVSINNVGDNFIKLGYKFRDTGIQASDTFAAFTTMADGLEYATVGMGQAADETYFFAKTLQGFGEDANKAGKFAEKFSAILPGVFTKGLQAFGSISPEAYLAYLNKPIRNIGEAMYQATMATPIQKMMAARARLMPEAARGVSAEDIAGRMMLLVPELQKMGPLGALLGRYLTQMKPAEAKEFSMMSPDQQEKFLQAMASPKDRDQLKNIGATILRFSDPMQTLINLVEGILDLFGTFSAGIRDIFLSSDAKNKVNSEIKRIHSKIGPGSSSSSSMSQRPYEPTIK